jgi:hypothetical protein
MLLTYWSTFCFCRIRRNRRAPCSCLLGHLAEEYFWLTLETGGSKNHLYPSGCRDRPLRVSRSGLFDGALADVAEGISQTEAPL